MIFHRVKNQIGSFSRIKSNRKSILKRYLSFNWSLFKACNKKKSNNKQRNRTESREVKKKSWMRKKSKMKTKCNWISIMYSTLKRKGKKLISSWNNKRKTTKSATYVKVQQQQKFGYTFGSASIVFCFFIFRLVWLSNYLHISSSVIQIHLIFKTQQQPRKERKKQNWHRHKKIIRRTVEFYNLVVGLLILFLTQIFLSMQSRKLSMNKQK